MTPLSTIASLIGIDPGTETLGLSVLRFDVISLQIVDVEAHTFVGSRLPYMSDYTATLQGERYARLQAHRQNLTRVFQVVRPLTVVSESPFFNPRQPSAGGALVETIDTIRLALRDYDPEFVLQLIDPSSVKNAVGAKGNAGKDDVKAALAKLLDTMPISPRTPFATLSEHAIDSIAVAYSRYKQYRQFHALRNPY